MVPRQLSWRKTVTELLSAAGVSQAEVAEKIKRPRSNVTRWLNGSVKPTAVNVRAVNRAVAFLTDSWEVEPYLAVTAIVTGMESSLDWHDLDVGNLGASNVGRILLAATRLLSDVEEFFEGDVHKALAVYLQSDLVKGLALYLTLAFGRGQQILARLGGAASTGSYVDAVAATFEKAGLASLIKRDAATDVLRARERTRSRIDQVLAKVSVPPRQKMRLARKLQGVTDGIFSAILSSNAGRHGDCLATIVKELSRGASTSRKGKKT